MNFGDFTHEQWLDYRETVDSMPRMGSITGHVGPMISYRKSTCENICTCTTSRTYKSAAVWSEIMKVPEHEVMPMEELGMYAHFG